MINQINNRLKRKAKCDCCKRVVEIETTNNLLDDNSNLLGYLNLCYACTKQFTKDALKEEFNNEIILQEFSLE